MTLLRYLRRQDVSLEIKIFNFEYFHLELTSVLPMHAVTSSQIERLWSRFTSLDKQQKGFLSREDFLRIPGTDLSIQSRRMQSKDLTEQWAILIWVICEDV